MSKQSETSIVQRIFVIRDTAIGKDIATGIFIHDGEAVAWLANYCISFKRLSFDVYKIGYITEEDGLLNVEHCKSSYVCSANMKMLESYSDTIERLLTSEEDIDA